MCWLRARTKEQVACRMDELVGTAARLYDSVEYEAITLARIAREAGWTRSNVYKYFATKEEILLELLSRDLANWRRDAETRFAGGPWAPADFAGALVDSYWGNERMVRLLTVLHTALEKNSSVEKLAAFKRRAMAELAVLLDLLARALPFRDTQAARDFLYAQMMLLMGAYPMCTLSEKQRRAMAEAGMTEQPDYFRELLRRNIEAALVPLLRTAPAPGPHAIDQE